MPADGSPDLVQGGCARLNILRETHRHTAHTDNARTLRHCPAWCWTLPTRTPSHGWTGEGRQSLTLSASSRSTSTLTRGRCGFVDYKEPRKRKPCSSASSTGERSPSIAWVGLGASRMPEPKRLRNYPEEEASAARCALNSTPSAQTAMSVSFSSRQCRGAAASEAEETVVRLAATQRDIGRGGGGGRGRGAGAWRPRGLACAEPCQGDSSFRLYLLTRRRGANAAHTRQ